MSDLMTFPYSVEEFMERYKIVDTDGIYMSKGAELVPIFRMRQWFEHLPSAQRTGRWIDGKVKHIKNGELRNVRECSECGSSYFVYDYYNSVDEIPKFCPNCGARMEVEER